MFFVKFLKPKKIDFQPRLKMKGKSKTGRKEARKKAVKVAGLKEFVKEVREFAQSEQELVQKASSSAERKFCVFDRFKKRKWL